MKDKRKISVQNSNLRRFRNNLRNIIFEANVAILLKIREEMEEITTKSDGSNTYIDSLAPKDLKKFRKLQSMHARFSDIGGRSICSCHACGKSDRNMIYNKPYVAWYCIECYDRNKNFYKRVLQERAEKGIAKADYDDFDEDYYKSFIDQDFQVDPKNREKLLRDKFNEEIGNQKDYNDPETLLKEFVLDGNVDEELAKSIEEYVFDKNDERSGHDS